MLIDLNHEAVLDILRSQEQGRVKALSGAPGFVWCSPWRLAGEHQIQDQIYSDRAVPISARQSHAVWTCSGPIIT